MIQRASFDGVGMGESVYKNGLRGIVLERFFQDYLRVFLDDFENSGIDSSKGERVEKDVDVADPSQRGKLSFSGRPSAHEEISHAGIIFLSVYNV